MWKLNYAAHSAFIEAATERAQIWRIFLGFLLIIAGFFALGIPVFRAMQGFFTLLSQERGFVNVLAMLFSFGALSISVFITVQLVHKRNWHTVLGDIKQGIAHFFLVSWAMILLYTVMLILPPWGYEEALEPNRALLPWLITLPLALVAVLVQTASEEILFRGYLQQNLAARFKSPLVWMFLPSALFAIAHYDPNIPEENLWIMIAWAGVFGLLMADLTARAGTLGPAIAIHFINNVAALLIVSLPDQLGGAALYWLPFGMNDVQMMRAWIPVDFATTLVMWLAARLMLRR